MTVLCLECGHRAGAVAALHPFWHLHSVVLVLALALVLARLVLAAD